MLLWLLAVLLIPVLMIVLLAVSAADDLWSIVTFQIDLSRLFGDLIHVLAILGIGTVAELFSLFELVIHLL
ncbi:hypothetical protein [Thiomonas sp.]